MAAYQSVIDHDYEEEELRGCSPCEKIKLGNAAPIGDKVLLWHQTLQCFGHNGESTDNVHSSQVEQEKEHGSVEPRVEGDGQNDEDVTCEGHRVEGEETAE